MGRATSEADGQAQPELAENWFTRRCFGLLLATMDGSDNQGSDNDRLDRRKMLSRLAWAAPAVVATAAVKARAAAATCNPTCDPAAGCRPG